MTGRGTTTKRSKKRPRGARRTTSNNKPSSGAPTAATHPPPNAATTPSIDLSEETLLQTTTSSPSNTTTPTTTNGSRSQICTAQKKEVTALVVGKQTPRSTSRQKSPRPTQISNSKPSSNSSSTTSHTNTKSKSKSKPKSKAMGEVGNSGGSGGGCGSANPTQNSSSPRANSPQSYPRTRTLVNGEYIEHNPGGLQEPLSSGFKSWALSQRIPQTPHTSRWNNRLLQYWRLATDSFRFEKDDEDTNVDNLKKSEQLPLYRMPAPPQRPYTAPAHQLDVGELKR